MKLSVALICYNDYHTVKSCMEAILKQLDKYDEIIVADNNSNEQTKQEINKISNSKIKKIFWRKNYGVAVGRNKILKLCNNEVIVFIDSDMILSEGSLNAIRKNIISNDALVGKYHNYGIVNIYKCIVYLLYSKKNINYDKMITYDDFLTMSGGMLAIKKSVFEKYKYDIAFKGLPGEDIDLELRMLTDGLKIKFVPAFYGSHYKMGFKLKSFLLSCNKEAKSFNLILGKSLRGIYKFPRTNYFPKVPYAAMLSLFLLVLLPIKLGLLLTLLLMLIETRKVIFSQFKFFEKLIGSSLLIIRIWMLTFCIVLNIRYMIKYK